MIVNCPRCGHQGNLPDDAEHAPRVRCSQCQQEFGLRADGGLGSAVPSPSSTGEDPDGSSRVCTRCGERNEGSRSLCTRCGNLLPAPKVADDDNTMGGLIPYKNSQA